LKLFDKTGKGGKEKDYAGKPRKKENLNPGVHQKEKKKKRKAGYHYFDLAKKKRRKPKRVTCSPGGAVSTCTPDTIVKREKGIYRCGGTTKKER